MGDYVLVPRVATEAMVSAGLPHLDGQNKSDVRPVGQFYSGMTADESEAANWKYCGDERLRRAYAAMLAARPPVEWTDLMAMATVAVDKAAAPHVLADADMRRTIICCTAQALREICP